VTRKAPPSKAGARKDSTRPAKPPRKRGRPSSYTDAMARRVIVFFTEGGTRHGLDADRKLPSWPTFKRWMESRPELRSQYVRAKEDQADALFEEALNEVRSCPLDSVAVTLARVRSDLLMRAAARRRPKVYLERVMAEEIAADHRLQAFEQRAQERGRVLQGRNEPQEDAPVQPPGKLVLEVVGGADHSPEAV
jgi:hypothetical protein